MIEKYHIPAEIAFTFVTKDGWIIATAESLPGFITEARNPEELLEMIHDGILMYFDVPQHVGRDVQARMTFDGFGTVSLGNRLQMA